MTLIDENTPKLTENMFSSLVSTNIIGIFIATPEGLISDANDKYLEITGYTREDIAAGKINWMALMPPEHRNKHKAVLKELYETGYSSGLENEYIRKDGRRVPVIMGAGLLDNDTSDYIGFIVDLSKQKRVEQMLREKTALQSKAEQIAHFGAFEINVENKLAASCSDETYRILGISPNEPDYLDSYYKILHPDDRTRVINAMITALNLKEPFEIEYRIIRNDGQTRILYTKAEIVLNKFGEVARLIGTMHDVTGQRVSEKALIDAKNQSEIYLDLMGHDINNLDQVAKGYLEMAHDLIVDTGKLDTSNLMLIDKSLESIENVTRLIDNVRKLRKVHDKDFLIKETDLCQVLNDVQKEYSGVPGRTITLVTAETTCPVMATVFLKDVFANLVGNAIKHSNGSVAIRIALTRVKQEPGEAYRIAVEDNGPGIPDIRKEQVFQRFTQGSKLSGNGLGLYFVKTIIDAMNGRVRVEDRVKGDYAQGSRFVVELPVTNK
jgi:PAS domain S-box-containing protein